MITKKFIRNSIIYAIAGSLPLASSIILLPFYVKYLSPPVYGALILYTGFSLLVQVFVTYSFDTSVYTYYHDHKHDYNRLSIFISSVFNFILIISAATCILLAITGDWMFNRFFTEVKILFYPYGFLSVITGIFQALFKVNSNLLQTQEKADEFLNSNLLLFSSIAFFTITGLIYFPDDLLGPVGGRLVAVIVSGSWVLLRIYRSYGFHFDLAMMKSTLGYNQPILVYQILQWLNLYYDRLLMSRHLPLSAVGLYDLALKCLMAIEFVVAGFNSSFLPKVLGKIVLQKEKGTTVEINRYYNGLTAVSIILVALSIFGLPFVIEWMVQWFDKPQYLTTVPLIPWIAVGYLFRSMRLYMSMPYAALKNSKPMPVYYSVVIGIKIVLMIVLMDAWGIPGVIYSTWAGYLVEIIILYWGMRNKFEFKFNITKLVVAPLSFGILVVILEPLMGTKLPGVTHATYLLVAGLVLFWAYRNELRTIEWSKIIK